MASIMWFRRGLRLHDNPALVSAAENAEAFAAVYIFDPTDVSMYGYNLTSFLLECLFDLDKNLQKVRGKLHLFLGSPVDVFRHLHANYAIKKLSFEKDCEPIWHARDNAVKSLCAKLKIDCVEQVANTLWNCREVIKANGGSAPLTREMFTHVTKLVGDPPKPIAEVQWDKVKFFVLESTETKEFKMFSQFPTAGEIGVKNVPLAHQKRRIIGGETVALEQLLLHLKAEKEALVTGQYCPLQQAQPDLLNPPPSMSAAIAIGTLSVRLLYWEMRDAYNAMTEGNQSIKTSAWIYFTGQLIWREYFYTMCCLNPKYGVMLGNPICLQIPWNRNEVHFNKWKTGQTGYPFIDAGMRQLLQEGWMHHSVRTAVALFLTRGDLWLSWEKGCAHFRAHLVDHDWAVNAGNWMWVSSSAFDRLLDCSLRIDPVGYGKQLEPTGDYIRRYVPELAQFSSEYIHEPWKASDEEQHEAKCILGIDYPERMVIHEGASERNNQWMEDYRQELLTKMETSLVRSRPSSNVEILRYFLLNEGIGNLKKRSLTLGIRRNSTF